MLAGETNLTDDERANLEKYLAENRSEKVTFQVKLITTKGCYLCNTPVPYYKAKVILSISQERYPICDKCLKLMMVFRKTTNNQIKSE